MDSFAQRLKTYIRKTFDLRLLNLMVPKKHDRYVFLSNPAFSDNPYLFYKYLADREPEAEIIWLTEGPFRAAEFPLSVRSRKNTRVYRRFSLRGILSYMRAEYIVGSHASLNSLFGYDPRQRIISLWHGMPLKTIGFVEKSVPPIILKETAFLGKYAHFFVTSDYFRVIMSYCFHADERRVHITGQPRNDVILNANARGDLQKVLHGEDASRAAKIIFCTPTYKKTERAGVQDVQSEVLNPFYFPEFDADLLSAYLKEKNYLLIIKPHPFDEQYYRKFDDLQNEHLRFLYTDDFLKRDMNLYDILGAADLLITDYSSVYVDYMQLNRPVIFINTTEDEYRENRGFILNDNNHLLMVGQRVRTQDELVVAVDEAFSRDTFRNDRARIYPLLNKFNDGLCCERIYDVMKSLRRGKP